MSAKPTHDLLVKSGEYTDRNGETKTRWLKIGTMFSHAGGGTSIKLEAMPVGLSDWDGWVSVFEKRDQDQQPAQRRPAQHQRSAPAAGGFGDDIPFAPRHWMEG